MNALVDLATILLGGVIGGAFMLWLALRLDTRARRRRNRA